MHVTHQCVCVCVCSYGLAGCGNYMEISLPIYKINLLHTHTHKIEPFILICSERSKPKHVSCGLNIDLLCTPGERVCEYKWNTKLWIGLKGMAIGREGGFGRR